MAITLVSKIQADLHRAMEYVSGLSAEDMEIQNAKDELKGSEYAEFCDSDLVKFEEELTLTPDHVLLQYATDIGIAATVLGDILEGYFNVDSVNQIIEHECEHALVSNVLGFQDLKFGIQVSRNQGEWAFNGFHVQYKPTREISKLELASLLAAPNVPSKSDLHFVHNMGYRSVHDIALRSHASNNSGNFPEIQISLSISRSTSSFCLGNVDI